jgi:hypothetical protein
VTKSSPDILHLALLHEYVPSALDGETGGVESQVGRALSPHEADPQAGEEALAELKKRISKRAEI